MRIATENVTKQEGSGSAALWFGVLGAPLAWAVQLVLNYAFEEWLTCTPGSTTPGRLWGIGVERWVTGVTGVVTAVAVFAMLVSLSCYRRLRDRDTSTGDRARWMAFAGIVNSGIFLLPIGLGFVSPMLLDTCRIS
jgi:uncharacterized membrane protein YhaH (DUF805 family)